MDTFNNIWSKLGGRKLLAYFLGLTALVTLAALDMLSDTAMWGILGLAATYSGGNVGEHIAGALSARAKIPTPPAQAEQEEPGADDA